MQQQNNNQDNQSQQLQQAAQAEAFRAKQEEYMHLCYTALEVNPDGARLLAWLTESLIEQQMVADPEKEERFAYFREGQNSVLRGFVQNIKAYKQLMISNAAATTANNTTTGEVV